MTLFTIKNINFQYYNVVKWQRMKNFLLFEKRKTFPIEQTGLIQRTGWGLLGEETPSGEIPS